MELSLIGPAWSALGGPADRLEAVRLEGDPAGLLASRLPAFDAMASAVATSLLAAAELDAARTGRTPGNAFLDCEEVAVAARSERYARRCGSGAPNLFSSLSRFWRAADGWIRLHGNYPWHRQRALDTLGCVEDPDAIAAAIATWKALDLEDALAAAGALGYAVRTPAEWRAHPHGAAVAGRPLVEVVEHRAVEPRLGDGRVAAGVRVLDLTRVIAGPVATRTLSAWGANVLRLDGPDWPEIEDQAIDTLSGKASAVLDLGRDRDGLEELLGQADLLVQGYRPGALARFGLRPEDLAERHPHLAVVSISAWGEAGPWAARRGFDSLVQCPTGIASIEGRPDHPGALPAQVLDHATGYLAAAAGMRALAAAQRGEPVRSAGLALAATAHWLLGGGIAERSAARDPAAESFMVRLPGPHYDVEVVEPPGRLDDAQPEWHATSALGADAPAFSPA